jgi:hypothetical protein
MGAITLFSVYGQTPELSWWAVFAFCTLVFILATACVTVSSGPTITGWQERVARLTYKPAVILGRARFLYSVMFLFAIFSFYQVGSLRSVVLVAFWGLFISLWPLGVPELLSMFNPRRTARKPVGKVIRTDWPDIVRCTIRPDMNWSHDDLVIYKQADSTQRLVLPLYSQQKEDMLIGTGLCIGETKDSQKGMDVGYIYDYQTTDDTPRPTVPEMFGGSSTSKLVGFVIEDSDIGQIRFETWDPTSCREGMMVWCQLNHTKVFYQIVTGVTREETLEADRHGFQVANASQLGYLKSQSGFSKYDWLPGMNTPVFSEPATFGVDLVVGGEHDFSYGTIPGSQIKVFGDLAGTFDHHTAILGVTGSGKTELAYDMIRNAVAQGIKVLCIDLTARYEGKLADLNPRNLSISAELATELGTKLFDVETGTYGAPNEKKVLEHFSHGLRTHISETIEHFLTSGGADDRVGIIRLEEISNTKATLYITELYLTCLLRFAKDHAAQCPKTLVVVEEAHTVMPEPNTMGLGDFDSKGLVSKIAQIALQGRKYHVGLLVIAQRTATVSKSVLTQCNTIISFTCFDDTSLGFLKNIFGQAHISLIPNLPPLQAVVFGRGIKGERPVVIQVPYDANKAEAGA